MVQVVVSGTLAVIAAPLKALPARLRVEMERGLSAAGDKTRTQVRHALQDQTNVKRYGVVVAHASGSRNGLIYEIVGSGKGLKIEEFPLHLSRSRKMWVRWSPREHWKLQSRDGGRFGPMPTMDETGEVYAVPWGIGRTFVRSFVKPDGALRQANPGGGGHQKWRFRALYGPAIAKEIVKDRSLVAFETAVETIVMPEIEKRLASLVSEG